ncbi:heparinase II/III family protein [Paenibacillus sp. MBLB4367]|uniref:heparinase II/III domain-containing protein n=1 Tax=Paenibacillus sp. MBLB4367 TaxID=3384767 RepID=UPI003907F2C7
MKTRSTVYTPDKVAAARRNVQIYDWARTLKDEAVRKAERYIALGHEFLWRLVPPQTLPRSYGVNQKAGSPVTGKAIDRFGNYPYTGDPASAPWKIVDPSSGFTFPTNDFAAYYESGLDEQAVFRPELADRTLLINELYPEKGPHWGVDDGFGWVDEQGNRFTFIAYYVHWFLWHNESTGMIQESIIRLRDAYLYTGDTRYARAGTILLDRVADIYPELDVSVYDKTVYLNSHGGETGRGKAVGSIWESALVKDFVSAYDAFFPAMDDGEAIRFLADKAASCKLANAKNSAEAIRRNIEDGIVRQIYPAVRTAAIYGNTGFHQSALALAAVVYDTLPETREWLDFMLQPGGRESEPDWHVTGGNLAAALVGDVDRDGHGDEAAPHYNRLWLTSFQTVADILQGYDRCPEFDLYRHVKYKKMYAAPYPLLLSGNYTAQIGDSGKTGNPEAPTRIREAIKAFEAYGDPIHAQMAYFLNGNSLDGIHGDVFAADPESIVRRIDEVIGSHGTLHLPSVNLTGYGFAALRDGEAATAHAAAGPGSNQPSPHTMRDLWLYYGRSFGHGHRDTLNLGLHAFGLDLAPDLGYPEFADSKDRHRFEWVHNTISHNTVTVDRSKQKAQWSGKPLSFDDGTLVKLIDVEASEVYPQTGLYRRTAALIRINGEHSYIVDLFRVKGGAEHVYSFHGPEGEASSEGLTLQAQRSGTYAGPDVEYGVRPDSKEGPGYEGSGFHYLHQVRHDEAPGDTFAVDWTAVDTWGMLERPGPVHLRLTMLGDYDRVSLAEGIPPRNKPGNPQSLTYVLAKRHSGETALESLFSAIIEPYREQRMIRAVHALPVREEESGRLPQELEIRAVCVELANGRIDIIVSALHEDRTYRIGDKLVFRGSFGVYSEREGRPVQAYLHDGTLLGPAASPVVNEQTSRLEGIVSDFTKELSDKNEIVVRMNTRGVEPGKLAGRTIYVTGGVPQAAYEIKGAAYAGIGEDAERTIRLDIGDAVLVRRYADSRDMEKGFLYDIAEGSPFRIPLTYEAAFDA